MEKIIINIRSQVASSINVRMAVAFVTLMLLCQTVLAQQFPAVTEEPDRSAFPLFADGKAAPIVYDAQDYAVVSITSQMLADDVERTCGKAAEVVPVTDLSETKGAYVVLAGTLGQSRIINEVVARKHIDVSGIRGKWESFIITTVTKPTKGIQKALVIIGSDRRGTAFGLTSLSEAIGVSPWYFWADVTPEPKQGLYVENGLFLQGEPSVHYRGIFINDERFGGWARWAEQTYDKEHGVVGPKTYRQVFELLLRLKANYLWPAMHPGTQAFNADPENARLADDYAIVMGTSHCEQMLRNNEDEWKKKGTLGDFNYLTNKETMLRYWEERIQTNGQYENTYTIGLRGIHDYPMEGAATNEERIAIMQQAINDQRDILSRNIAKPIEEIPQVLCTYEEVLDAYHGGLQVPDDVTLLWSDDKQGYMRNLSNPQERQRKGGAGIYYHLSYHGDPDSWFWLSPLSPALISAELTKAYEYGARKIWVFNVGDIKPAEKELSLAMELAWNIDSWKPTEAYRFTEYWIAKTIGKAFAAPLAEVQNRYYRLMAYGKEFHTRWLEYSEEEIAERLKEWSSLDAKVQDIRQQLPPQHQTAAWELFEYPIRGANMMNQYVLLSRRSMVKADQRLSTVANDADDAARYRLGLDALTDYFNERIADGKWNHFFNWHPNWYLDGQKEVMTMADSGVVAQTRNMPQSMWILAETVNNRPTSDTVFTFTADRSGTMPLWIKARTGIRHNSFDAENNDFATVHLNGQTLRASAQPHGNIWHTDTIGPLWSQVGELMVEEGNNRLTLSDIAPGTQISAIYAGLQPPFVHEPIYRTPAYAYARKHDAEGATLTTIPLLGYQDGVTTLPFLTPSYAPTEAAPWLEYELPSGLMENTQGPLILEVRTLPTLRIYEGRAARYAVSIDDAAPVVFSIHEGDYTSEWRWNVLRNYTRRFVALPSNAKRVRIYLLDPGITLQELTINN